jgi:hypothetical protein
MRALFTKAATTITLFIAIQGGAAAGAPPLREWLHQDVTVRLGVASAVCGFDVFGHFEGDVHFTVFYDQNGSIVSEIDTFPSFKATVYAPSTGKSYTSASPAVLHTQYTDGAAIGSTATAEVTGLLEKFDGVNMEGGRLVFEGVVVGIDPAGVPLIRFVREISSSGPHIDTVIGVARCNAVR